MVPFEEPEPSLPLKTVAAILLKFSISYLVEAGCATDTRFPRFGGFVIFLMSWGLFPNRAHNPYCNFNGGPN
jgi:hypothetical protein